MLSFAATAAEVLSFAQIDRVGRDTQGTLSGFQRPQVAGHIREIQDYLEKDDAILPNPIVVAFIDGIEVGPRKPGGLVEVSIDISAGLPGLVVDGQQRLTALSLLEAKTFELFVSCVVCADEAELRRQFVLINNTRPLPKSLIYELLPSVDGLPRRLGERSVAAELTARLNYDATSSLKGMIHQHTNPMGIIRDTAIQRVIMQSASDGVIRGLLKREGGKEAAFKLVSEFFFAVSATFPDAWDDQTPKTSRLVHGAGIGALGPVMEILAEAGARTSAEFYAGLACLKGRTAWTEGHWDFGPDDRRHWKAIQNVNRDILKLTEFLTDIVRADVRKRRAKPASDLPLMQGAGQ